MPSASRFCFMKAGFGMSDICAGGGGEGEGSSGSTGPPARSHVHTNEQPVGRAQVRLP